jgi:hypothetical protein
MAAILSTLKPIMRAMSSIEVVCLILNHALPEDCARRLFLDDAFDVFLTLLSMFLSV